MFAVARLSIGGCVVRLELVSLDVCVQPGGEAHRPRGELRARVCGRGIHRDILRTDAESDAHDDECRNNALQERE